MITSPVTNFSKDTYCGWCGTKFAEQTLYPRSCFQCGNDTQAPSSYTPVTEPNIEVGDRVMTIGGEGEVVYASAWRISACQRC
jgi:hypothetical protein